MNRRRTTIAVVSSVVLLGGGATVARAAVAADNTTPGRAAARVVPATSAGLPPTAQVLWAVVNGNGVKARSFPATVITTRLGTGTYQVDFRQDLTGCAFVATIGQPATGTASPGVIATAARAGVPTAVWVDTHTTTGAANDRPFHLIVAC